MAVYDALAKRYQHGMARVTGLHAPDIAEALLLQPNARVLDVAAGTGAITEAVAWYVGEDGLVLAVDIAPGMLSVARDRLASVLPQVRYLLTSAESLAICDGAVDAVACAFGIQHMAEPVVALRSMRAVLVPGGRCAVTVWAEVGKDIKTPINQAFAALNAQSQLSPGQVTWSTPGYLGGRLYEAGFLDVEERLSEGWLPVATLDEWWEAVTSGALGNRLRASGPERAARVREDAYRRAERFATRDGDGWRFPSAAVIAVGVAPR